MPLGRPVELRRSFERRIGEASGGNSDDIRQGFETAEDPTSASRTEGRFVPASGARPAPAAILTLDRRRGFGEERRVAERAARPSLTFQATAGVYPCGRS